MRSLRAIHQNPQLQNALYQLTNKTQVTIELSFPVGEQPAFESVLRNALNDVLVEGAAFDDQRWQQAVERELVFEQTLSVLPLGAQLILFIDNLSGRWLSMPEVVEDDLKWLKRILRQAQSLPLRAVSARATAAGKGARLTLKLRGTGTLRSALAHHRRVTATVTVVATNAAGKTATATRRITITP